MAPITGAFSYMRLLPILLLISFFSFGQSSKEQEKKDSIFYYLKEAKGSVKHAFLKRAVFLSEEISNDSLFKISNIKYGQESYVKKDTLGIEKAYKNLQTLYRKNKDSIALAKHYHYKGLKFRRQFKLDSSYYYYDRSKQISILLNDSLQAGRRLLSMAYMQNGEKDYVGAEATAISALEFLTPLKEIEFTGDSYNILGNALANLGDYKEARKSYETSRQIFSQSSNEEFKTGWELYLINNIGYTYLKEEKYLEASKFFEKGLSLDSLKLKYLRHYQVLLGNYSDCLYYLGEKKQAFKNYNEVLKMREQENNIYGQSLLHNGFAIFYDLEGKTKKSLFHARKGYELAKKVNNNDTKLSTLRKLIKLTTGSSSKKYFAEYTTLNDSLNKRERFFKKQFANIRYETEKINKENINLKVLSEQERAKANKQRQQKIISWLLTLAAVLTLGFSFYIFKARRKKLMYEAQLQKASAREEERQQIAKSLHDEVAGDLRVLHQKLSKTELLGEAKSVEKIKDNVRNLSHQLSSVSFEEVSFKDQLINLISDNFSLDFRISTEGIDTVPWEEINNTIKRTLYLSIRESLQNTLKYAKANKFFIQFSSEKKEILLLLKDNGKGFEKGKGKKGIGLKNLKERVEEIHGTFQIDSSEEGTQTNISIPINGR